MDTLKDFGQWWNLIYILPFGLAVLQVIVSALGLAPESEGEHDTDLDHDVDHDLDHEVDHDLDHDVDHDLDHEVDHDLDHEVDHDLDHDVDHDLDHDVDHDLDHDVDHDLDHDVDHGADLHHEMEHGAEAHLPHAAGEVAHHAEPNLFVQALAFYGVGRVPLSVVLQAFCFSWGVLGLLLNQCLSVSRNPVMAWPGLAIAFMGSTLFTRGTAGLIARMVPRSGTSAVRKQSLQGRIGKVVFTVTDSAGTVHIRDDYGTLHQLAARVEPGEAPIPPGTEVLLLGYDRGGKWYWVEEWLDDPRTRLHEEELKEVALSATKE